jgi:hypothetical protein
MHGQSVDYYKCIDYLRKRNGRTPREDVIRQSREAFHQALGHLPSPFLDEAFRYYADRMLRAEAGELYDLLYHLGSVIDLLAREYDEQNERLTDDEWQFLQELVSDFADQLDMETVSYVMGAALSGGHFHHGGPGAG